MLRDPHSLHITCAPRLQPSVVDERGLRVSPILSRRAESSAESHTVWTDVWSVDKDRRGCRVIVRVTVDDLHDRIAAI